MLKQHTISFKNAFAGVAWSLRTQPNYRIHFFFSFLAIAGSVFFKVSYEEFLIIIVLITVGLVVETLNTSIEAATDAIDQKWRQDIKTSKDVAAAAMLFYATGAVITAGIIFIPKILSLTGL